MEGSRGAMKPYTGYRLFFGGFLSFHRSSSRRIPAISITLLLLCCPAVVSTANAAAPASGARVYLLRGVLNIFSLGLDQIAAKLQAQGIPVTVANFVSWSSLADEAAAEYRSGRVRTIILVGHSSGATALPDMVARLGQLGVPVKLAIGLDQGFPWHAGERRRPERAWRGAHLNRQEPDYSAEGDNRDRRRRVQPSAFRSAEAVAGSE